MISAVEALGLPSAQLSEEERAAADKLEADIEVHIRAHMERRGTDYKTHERRASVVADVNQRLRAAGWNTIWKPWFGAEMLSRSQQPAHIGWTVELAPTDEAYQAAVSLVAN